MKIVYIAGPYGGGKYPFEIVEQNIQRARYWAIKCANEGMAYICPHLNSAHFEVDAHQEESFYLQMDLSLLAVCDVILMIPEWQNSTGAMREKELMDSWKKPVFLWQDFDLLIDWYRKDG